MKKVLFLIFASLLVLGACGNNDSEKKEDNKSSEHKKSNDSKKDKKSDDKKDNSKDNKKSESKNEDTTSIESQSTSKNDNGKSQDNNGNNERIQGKQTTQQNNNQQQSSNQQSQNNNGYMSQAEIDEWNRTKPTTHDESQMGYGRSEYEEARKASAQVWDNPNAHVGGPIWVGKNEGYDSWANRQKEVAEMQSE
ncbi:hypothetical protein WCU86_11005 [Staphylococcus epidermidis]|uniref:hypothetical protein n=1 Tax=Staphylococcus epidermidis TaxID=1282 RepID=UPI003076067E